MVHDVQWASDEETVEAWNEPGPHGHDISIVHMASARLIVIFHGRVQQPQRLLCRCRWYSLARLVVEHYLHWRGDQRAVIHEYATDAIQKATVGRLGAFIYFPTGTIHQTPRNSVGHELAHFVSYHALGGRAASSLIEEACAKFFCDPVYHVGFDCSSTYRELRQADTQERVIRVLQSPRTLRPRERFTLSLFVGYLLLAHGVHTFRRFWKSSEPLHRAVATVYGKSIRETVRQWAAQWHDRQHLHDAARAVAAAGLTAQYGGCLDCGRREGSDCPRLRYFVCPVAGEHRERGHTGQSLAIDSVGISQKVDLACVAGDAAAPGADAAQSNRASVKSPETIGTEIVLSSRHNKLGEVSSRLLKNP